MKSDLCRMEIRLSNSRSWISLPGILRREHAEAAAARAAGVPNNINQSGFALRFVQLEIVAPDACINLSGVAPRSVERTMAPLPEATLW